ncbi:MAG: type II secretion system protein [Candidatus Shapirobacteria bacterium]
MSKNNRGQSLVEVVVGVGIMALTLSGVVALMVFSMGARSKGIDRKKASEVAATVAERLVEQRNGDPAGFWGNINNNQTGTIDEVGYVAIFQRKTNLTDPGCSSEAEPPTCVSVNIRVTWGDPASPQEYKIVRYFTRY